MGLYSYLTKYLPYASTKQKEAINTLVSTDCKKKTLKKLQCSRTNLNKMLQRAKATAERSGFNEKHGITDRHIHATSTLYKEGEEVLRWVKAKTPHEQKLESVANLFESYELTPLPKVKPPKKNLNSDLATLYTITDFHLGMYSWAGESLEEWTTEIAGKVMLNAITDMINKSDDAEVGILNIQGDFLHWDGLDAVTPMNKHVLDADTRFDKMIELAMDLNMWAIELLLKKHEVVKVIICEGNHDLAGSAWLRKFVKKMTADNPRVEVDDTPIPYYAYLHGKIMLGFHHGHKMKNASLPALFSSEPRYRGLWGAAEYTYIHTGHYHHTEQKISESGGAIVERHPTLASRDAYAVRGGYISMRGARAITYDKNLGEVERITVLPREN